MQKKEVAKTHLPCVGVGMVGVVESGGLHTFYNTCVSSFASDCTLALWLGEGDWGFGGGGEGCFVKCKVSGLFIKRKD